MEIQHTHPHNQLSLTQWRTCPGCQRNALVHRAFMALAVPLYSARKASMETPITSNKYFWQREIVQDAHNAIALVESAGNLDEAAAYRALTRAYESASRMPDSPKHLAT